MTLETPHEARRAKNVSGQETVEDKAGAAQGGHRQGPASPPQKQSAWSSLRAGVKRRNLLSKWLSSGSSDGETPNSKWPDDAKESRFCNALVGLMQRSGGYHDLGKDKKESRSPERKKRKSSSKSAK